MSTVPHIPLHTHLTPDLVAQLARDGDLPAAVRAELALDLQQTLAAYAAFIPSRLVRAQLADPSPGRVGGAFWHGTLLFADMSGFTALSEKLSILGKQGAEEISAIINRLFALLVDAVHAHHGALLKFGGDALTAFFDENVLGTDHAAAATQAALAMQQQMEAFHDLETRGGTFTLRLRVGVHSGRVFAAEVGDQRHIELVVTGPAVNRVALAQEIAAPGQVVLSAQTIALLDGATYAPIPASSDTGFQSVVALDARPLAVAPPALIAPSDADDIETLTRLAIQIAALQPYLVRNLPRRFLGPAASELGEFRPVSVLFANFHDFSTMLAALGDDATTAAAVLNAYFRRAQTVVHRYDGIVNKVDMSTHGDKLMALFGAPTAHEDEPLRAVRCALDLEQALAEANAEIATLLPQPVVLHQKIGINTGTVFAGRVGSVRRHEYTVMGPKVNLAARLMSAATDGVTLLSPSTYTAVQHQIAGEVQKPLAIKGLAEPVTPVRALHVFETERTRFTGTDAMLHRAPLVGRDAEMDLLVQEATYALDGAGRTLAIVGEAGAGKTRLYEELVQRLVVMSGPDSVADVPSFMIYSGECQSYEQRTPYVALRHPLRHLLGFTPHRPSRDIVPAADAQLAALRDSVADLAPDLVRFTPLLGDVLGVPLPESPLTRALTVAQRHDRVQELVVALWLGAARHEPLLLAFDDLQWGDTSSREILARLTHKMDEVPLLLVVNYRPDPPIPEPWCELATSTRLVLNELSPANSALLLESLLGGPPPPSMLALLDRTQGNPFFIEELVRTLISSGALARTSAAQWHLTNSLDQVAIPKSVEGLLIARLDRLDEPHYELVQVASVIGRRFQRPVVEDVYTHITPLDESLERLVAVEVVTTELYRDDWEYLFRHALLRDVAYEGILYARRRDLHRRVANRIEYLSADHLSEHLGLLAWHYFQAETWESAFRYHIAAGMQAQERYANHDALALLTIALQIAPRLAPEHDAARLVVEVSDLHERIGDLHVLLGDYEQAEGAYQEALALLAASATQTTPQRVRLHRLLAIVQERRSDYDSAFDWLVRGIAQATVEAEDELARCYLLGAGMYQRQGDYARSLEWARIGLALAERRNSPRDQAEAFMLMGGTYRNLGNTTQARAFTTRSLDLYAELQDLTRLADAHNNLANMQYETGQLTEAKTHYQAGGKIKQAIGDVYGQAMIANNLGELLRTQGDLERAIEQYQQSLHSFEQLGSQYASGVLLMNLGGTYLLKGDLDGAATYLERSATLFEQVNAEEFLPELERYRAELALQRGDIAAARQACEVALAAATRQQARMEEGITRRVLGQIITQTEAAEAAWAQYEQSLALLREADNPLETARTLVAMAALAPALHAHAHGQTALDEALGMLQRVGAQRDIATAHAVAAQHGYRAEF